MSPTDVASWMVAELSRNGELYQEDAAEAIRDRFGDEFVYENDNGNLAIDKAVLTAFRKATGDTVVWVKGERCWRRREDHDGPGRAQD